MFSRSVMARVYAGRRLQKRLQRGSSEMSALLTTEIERSGQNTKFYAPLLGSVFIRRIDDHEFTNLFILIRSLKNNHIKLEFYNCKFRLTLTYLYLDEDMFWQFWNFPLLKEANFKCQKCDSQSELSVHHDKETFSSIMRRAYKDTLGIESKEAKAWLTYEQKHAVAEKIVEIHINEKISGVVVCHSCHEKEHGRRMHRNRGKKIWKE